RTFHSPAYTSGGNLDIGLRLLDGAGNALAVASPVGDVDATISVAVGAGTYYLEVDGVGDPATYSDYASLGQYTLIGSGAPGVGDSTPPTVAIAWPSAGTVLDGTHRIAVDASDDVGVTRVEVMVDGAVIGTDVNAPYGAAWNTMNAATGVHVISARAYDAAGNARTSTAVAVTVARDENLGFESPWTSTYVYTPAGPGWTFSGYAGVATNGSGFTGGNPPAPEGRQVAFLQITGAMSQPFAFVPGLAYVVRFAAAQRGNWQASRQDFQVYVDDRLVGSYTPGGTAYDAFTTASFTATASSHVVRFVGRDSAGGDNTVFIDRVRIESAIANHGFESPSVGTYRYNPAGAGWTFAGNAGIAANASGFTAGNPPAIEGVQVAFLQWTGTMAQSVALEPGADYVVRFVAAQRGNYQSSRQDLDVTLDGRSLGAFTPATTSYRECTTRIFTAGAARQVLMFAGRNSAGGDNTAFIDDVRIEKVRAAVDLGFETPFTTTFAYAPRGSGWTFDGGSGVTANGSGFTAGNPSAPEGGQAAFVQGKGTLFQPIGGFTPGGQYAIRFAVAQRGNWQANAQYVEVFIDGTSLGYFRPAGTGYEFVTTRSFTATARSHTVRFTGMNPLGGDNTALIDAVQIVPLGMALPTSNG
nr:DUF642 domain-containing protein [Acidobacteriota bacterium]